MPPFYEVPPTSTNTPASAVYAYCQKVIWQANLDGVDAQQKLK